ncbi:MAG: hypothetical protein ACRDF5_01030 [bacterium]
MTGQEYHESPTAKARFKVSVVDVLNEEVMPGMETLSNPGLTVAVRYSPRQDFRVRRLEWWIGRGSSSKLILTVSIREDYDGRPGKKLGEGSTEVSNGPTWFGADFEPPVSLTHNHDYWLAYRGVTTRDAPPIVGFSSGGKPVLGKAEDNEMFIPPFAPTKPEGQVKLTYFASLDDANWVLGPHAGAFKFRMYAKELESAV